MEVDIDSDGHFGTDIEEYGDDAQCQVTEGPDAALRREAGMGACLFKVRQEQT